MIFYLEGDRSAIEIVCSFRYGKSGITAGLYTVKPKFPSGVGREAEEKRAFK